MPWATLGVAILITGATLFSAATLVLDFAGRSPILGIASGLTFLVGLGSILHGLVRECRAYRRLHRVDRMRIALARRSEPLDTMQAVALEWVTSIAERLPDAAVAIRAVGAAASWAELEAAVRNRAAEPLHQKARAVGRRAALQGAGLVALSPHASWDGLIAGLRALAVLREIAHIFGLRPGPVVTLLLLRRVAWTAASTAGIDLLSQSLADHTLSALPVVKHIAAAVPGSGVAAIRLYRMASLTAEACCPVPRDGA